MPTHAPTTPHAPLCPPLDVDGPLLREEEEKPERIEEKHGKKERKLRKENKKEGGSRERNDNCRCDKVLEVDLATMNGDQNHLDGTGILRASKIYHDRDDGSGGSYYGGF